MTASFCELSDLEASWLDGAADCIGSAFDFARRLQAPEKSKCDIENLRHPLSIRGRHPNLHRSPLESNLESNVHGEPGESPVWHTRIALRFGKCHHRPGNALLERRFDTQDADAISRPS